MTIAANTSFRPSTHGWAFDNFGSFGNCGGMCWAALDYYYLKHPMDPSLATAPHALEARISRRQKDTLDRGMWAKVVEWTTKPGPGGILGIEKPTQEVEWPLAKHSIDHGEPMTLCLIRQGPGMADPTDNHQVIAWGYDYDPATSHVSLRVYDPNRRGADGMTLEFNARGTFAATQRLDGAIWPKPLRGFFVMGYDKEINVHLHRIDADGTVGQKIDQRTWRKGWTSARIFSTGQKTCLFLLKAAGYGSDDKNVHIHAMNGDGTVGERLGGGAYRWTQGWTSAEFYSMGGRTFLLVVKAKGYATDDKNAHVYAMNPDGTLGNKIAAYRWTEGWTTAKVYSIGGRTFLFLLKSNGYGKDDRNVHVYAMNADGTLGVKLAAYRWTEGWTSAQIHSTGGRTFLFLLKKKGYGSDDKNVHLHTMNADGSVGADLARYRWTEGWTTAEFYSIGGRAFLLALKAEGYASDDKNVHIYGINTDGSVGDKLAASRWTEGWTTVEPYAMGGTPFLLLLKEHQNENSWWDIPYV